MLYLKKSYNRNGLSSPPSPLTRHPHLPLHRQTYPLHQQQRKSTLHRHHPLHLPRLLPNTHLRRPPLGRQRPLLLDARHPRLQQRHPHGTWPLPRCLSRLDTPTPGRHQNHRPGFAQPSGSQIIRRVSKITSHDHRFRLSLRLHLVRRLRTYRRHRSRERNANCSSTNNFRFHRNSTRRHVAKRIRTRFRSIAVHRCQHIRKHNLAVAKSNHNKIRIRN